MLYNESKKLTVMNIKMLFSAQNIQGKKTNEYQKCSYPLCGIFQASEKINFSEMLSASYVDFTKVYQKKGSSAAQFRIPFLFSLVHLITALLFCSPFFSFNLLFLHFINFRNLKKKLKISILGMV